MAKHSHTQPTMCLRALIKSSVWRVSHHELAIISHLHRQTNQPTNQPMNQPTNLVFACHAARKEVESAPQEEEEDTAEAELNAVVTKHANSNRRVGQESACTGADSGNDGGDSSDGNGDVEQAAGGKRIPTSLSFTPFTIAFRGVKYHVPKPEGKVGRIGVMYHARAHNGKVGGFGVG